LKSDRKYIVLLVLAFVAFVLVEYNAPKPVNWSPTYSKKDKIPYGGYVVHDFLPDLFPGKRIIESNRTAYIMLDNYDSAQSNYIIINNEFKPDTLDTKTILDYVGTGSNVFMAAEDFEGALADSLKIKTSVDFGLVNNAKDSVSLNFEDKDFHSAKNYRYRKGTVDYYFTNYDTAHTTVLGKNSLNQANYIKIRHGNGAFYVSSVPLAFTNYNALKGQNNEYITRALSYLPVIDTRWDEYYKIGKGEADTPLRFILNNGALKRAYYIMLFGLLLYILFEGKRKQRVIPIINPLQNTSLEFVETIGMLYYQKGTNAGIARKKIQFFYDHLRNEYNLNVTVMNEEFYSTVARKTGSDIAEIRNLFTFITSVSKMETVSEATLISLNNLIEDFYQKTK
jgi:hypothetical protein